LNCLHIFISILDSSFIHILHCLHYAI
jgi:hypothetical protein